MEKQTDAGASDLSVSWLKRLSLVNSMQSELGAATAKVLAALSLWMSLSRVGGFRQSEREALRSTLNVLRDVTQSLSERIEDLHT